ncbi:SpoIIAA family protein [Aquirhabdus parva]|nr:STAS/SEC14 domain-containing protein [Aquirhabdus parva]
MIYADLLPDHRSLIIKPAGTLSQSDFERLSLLVDPYLERGGRLYGLMIYTQSFVNWRAFKLLLPHLQFIRNHHQQIQKISLVTDDMTSAIIPALIKHFVDAEIRSFAFQDKQPAIDWLSDQSLEVLSDSLDEYQD